MNGKLMFVPDDWAVVPKEPTIEMIGALGIDTPISWTYRAMILASPQLTAPPVLRWKGEWLILGNEKIAVSTEDYKGCFWVTLLENGIGGRCESMAEGRRAAEKALGLPECPEL